MYRPIDMDSLKLNQNFRWIVEKKNFFSQEECEEMKKYIDENSKRARGHVSDLEGDSINFKWGKKDCVMNISTNERQDILDKFWTTINVANQLYYHYDIKGIYHNRIQAHRYDVDDTYNPHSDFHNYNLYSSLKLTSIVFLNDHTEYEGGEFMLFDGTIIEPEVGKLVIHPAFAGHGVAPITKGHRYSCVCWAVGDTFV